MRGADTINQKILYSIWDSSGCLIHVEDEILKRQLNRRSLFYLRKKIGGIPVKCTAVPTNDCITGVAF